MKALLNFFIALVFTPFVGVAIIATGAAILILWPLMPFLALFAGEDTDTEQ